MSPQPRHLLRHPGKTKMKGRSVYACAVVDAGIRQRPASAQRAEQREGGSPPSPRSNFNNSALPRRLHWHSAPYSATLRGIVPILPGSDTPPLVLIVDDHEDARYVYAHFLERAGLRVVTASNGAEGIDLARRLKPGVIVMDLSMPELDGWEATRVLKADPATRLLCVIVLTGFALHDAIRRALETGCDRYLMKPCLPDKLLAVILDILRDQGRDRAVT